MAKDNRCVVCGKAIAPGRKVVRITRGTLNGRKWKERGRWGDAHETCFATAVESPTLVMDELRKASREPPSETASE